MQFHCLLDGYLFVISVIAERDLNNHFTPVLTYVAIWTMKLDVKIFINQMHRRKENRLRVELANCIYNFSMNRKKAFTLPWWTQEIGMRSGC